MLRYGIVFFILTEIWIIETKLFISEYGSTRNIFGELKPFESYGDVVIDEVDVPPATDSVKLEVQLVILVPDANSAAKCTVPVMNLFAYPGAYPLMKNLSNYVNTTIGNSGFFTPDSSIFRSARRIGSIQNHGHFNIRRPEEGKWYVLAVLTGHDNDGDYTVKKSLFGGISCHYFYNSRHYVSRLSNNMVKTVAVDEPINITLSVPSSDEQLLRFWLPVNAFAFTVQFSNCVAADVNRSDDIWSDDVCPVKFQLRASAIPFDSGRSHETDCSLLPSGRCSLTVNSPLVSRFYYIRVRQAFISNSISFRMNITAKSCYEELTKHHLQSNTYVAVVDDSYLLAINSSQSNASPFQRHSSSFVTSLNVSQLNWTSASNETPPSPTTTAKPTPAPIVPEAPRCSLEPLARVINLQLEMGVLFNRSYQPDIVEARDRRLSILQWQLKPTDIGGTLIVGLRYIGIAKQSALKNYWMNQTAVVDVCVSFDSLPTLTENNTLDCGDETLLKYSFTSGHGDFNDGKSFGAVKTFFNSMNSLIYPRIGNYFLSATQRCHNTVTGVSENCRFNTLVKFQAEVERCMTDEKGNVCSERGKCKLKHLGSDVGPLSYCECASGFRGYVCQNDALSLDVKVVFLQVFLLVVSNILFMPSIFLAFTRRLFIPTAIYTINMILSSIYHLCDTSDLRFKTCLADYDMLQFGDFFCSILSVCVTMITMTAVQRKVKSFLYTVGATTLALAVRSDRQNPLVFVVPIGVFVVIMFASWFYHAVRLHKVYPRPFSLLKIACGLTMALIGLMFFTVLETSANYPYTHSVWHCLIALSILFFLPPRVRRKTVNRVDSRAGLSDSESCSAVVSGFVDAEGTSAVLAERRPRNDSIGHGHVNNADEQQPLRPVFVDPLKKAGRLFLDVCEEMFGEPMDHGACTLCCTAGSSSVPTTPTVAAASSTRHSPNDLRRRLAVTNENDNGQQQSSLSTIVSSVGSVGSSSGNGNDNGNGNGNGNRNGNRNGNASHQNAGNNNDDDGPSPPVFSVSPNPSHSADNAGLSDVVVEIPQQQLA